MEDISADDMLWLCEAKRSKAREIGVGELCPPLRDNRKAHLLQGNSALSASLAFGGQT
jgi:hypothetical protein